MSETTKLANIIARQLWSMSMKKRDANLVDNLRNERFQRTFTDELFKIKAKPGYRPVAPEQKRKWQLLMAKGER